MSTRTHDYEALEREYLRSAISIRELCRRNDIKSFSAVALYAREHGWYEKREKIGQKAEEKTIARVSDALAEEETNEILTIRSEMLTVIRQALYKFAEDLKDPEYRIVPMDLIKLMNQGLLLMGEPTSRTEEKRLELSGTFEGLPPDVLRRLAEATRPRLVAGGSPDLPARVRSEDARAN